MSASRRFPFSIPSKHLGVLDGMENPRVTPGCGIRGSSAPKVRPIPAWAARPRDGAGGESRTKGPSHPQRFPRAGPQGDPGRWVGPSALLISRCFLPGPHGPGWYGAGLWPLWMTCRTRMDRAFSLPDFALLLTWASRPGLVWSGPLALVEIDARFDFESRRMRPGTPFPFSIPSKRLGVLDGMENPRVTPGCGIRGSSAPKVRRLPAWAARPRDGAGGRIEDQRSVPSAAVPKGRTTRRSGPMGRAFSPPDFALLLTWASRPRLVWSGPLALVDDLPHTDGSGLQPS